MQNSLNTKQNAIKFVSIIYIIISILDNIVFFCYFCFQNVPESQQMKKTSYISCVILTFLFTTCKKIEQRDEDKINALVSDAGKFETPPPNSETYSNASIDSVLQGTKYVKCTTQTVHLVKRIEDYQIFYSQDYAEIYPGNIIQGKYLKDGRLNSIGEFKRNPVTLLIQNASRSKSFDVSDPNRESLSSSVKNSDYYFYFDPPLYTYVNSVRAYSKHQVSLSLGINANCKKILLFETNF